MNGQTQLQVGDLVSVIGSHEDVAAMTQHLGAASAENLEADRNEFDFRRIFVSNRALTGRRGRDLNLQQQFDAFVTRVRRGDNEFVAHSDTVLELGVAAVLLRGPTR